MLSCNDWTMKIWGRGNQSLQEGKGRDGVPHCYSRVAQEAGEQVGGQIGYAVHLDARRITNVRKYIFVLSLCAKHSMFSRDIAPISHT